MIKKNITILIIFLLSITFVIYFYLNNKTSYLSGIKSQKINKELKEDLAVSTIAQGLEVPWSLVFLPKGDLFVTERKGTIRFISKNGEVDDSSIATLEDVKQIGEGGLHGITLHPNFSSNNFVYLYIISRIIW